MRCFYKFMAFYSLRYYGFFLGSI